MATITANGNPTDTSIAESYWKTLSSLSDSVKLRLATMLTSSVIEKVNEEESSMELTKRMLKKYSGAWIGDESSEEIISAIQSEFSTKSLGDKTG